jgi:hypothetical protein
MGVALDKHTFGILTLSAAISSHLLPAYYQTIADTTTSFPSSLVHFDHKFRQNRCDFTAFIADPANEYEFIISKLYIQPFHPPFPFTLFRLHHLRLPLTNSLLRLQNLHFTQPHTPQKLIERPHNPL